MMAISSSVITTTAPAMATVGGCDGTGVGFAAGVPSRPLGVHGKWCFLPLERGLSLCASFREAQGPRSVGWSIGDGNGLLKVRNSAVDRGGSVPKLAQRLGSTHPDEIRTGGAFLNGQHKLKGRPSRQIPERDRADVRAISNSVEETTTEPDFHVSVVENGDEGVAEGIGRRLFVTACAVGLVAVNSLGDEARVQAAEAPAKTKTKTKGRAPSSPYDEDRLLEQNRRMQKLNNAPVEFPGFVREGFQVKVIASDKYVTSKSGLMYYDMKVGQGEEPHDGQQVIFHYTGYNESGRRVDSSYQQGRPARTRLGIQGMIPGFEEGIKSMRAGGRRIIIVPPELGPPVGPSTFFSAKQFEVFDVELLETKECNRRTLLFYSDVVCD